MNEGPSGEITRRTLLGGLAAGALYPPAAAARQAARVSHTEIDGALEKAARWLVDRQQPDGSWRSETYGNMRDGASLTPTMLNTIYFLPQAGERGKAAFARGAAFVAGLTRDGKVIPPEAGLDYPALTAGPACRVLALSPPTPANQAALRAWRDYLMERRLDSRLGWAESDSEFGGWGFCPVIPRKPRPGEPRPPLAESNLVATTFGVLGMMSAKIPHTDPAYREILRFAFRCQNWAEPAHSDPRFDDGGFHFMPGDAAQNKAGVAGRDRSGQLRFRSYGSMTADGLRILIRCGLPRDHPRVTAALRWIERRWSPSKHPGGFPADRATLQQATYYYWAWAAAHAFLALDRRELDANGGRLRWAPALAAELIRQQRPDGSWVNRFRASREDDPLIATPLAASALALCRQVD